MQLKDISKEKWAWAKRSCCFNKSIVQDNDEAGTVIANTNTENTRENIISMENINTVVPKLKKTNPQGWTKLLMS